MNLEPVPSPFMNEGEAIDHGHVGLMADLNALYLEAYRYNFHDYKNHKYPMPKVALTVTLERIISRVKSGYYNNRHIV